MDTYKWKEDDEIVLSGKEFSIMHNTIVQINDIFQTFATTIAQTTGIAANVSSAVLQRMVENGTAVLEEPHSTLKPVE